MNILQRSRKTLFFVSLTRGLEIAQNCLVVTERLQNTLLQSLSLDQHYYKLPGSHEDVYVFKKNSQLLMHMFFGTSKFNFIACIKN